MAREALFASLPPGRFRLRVGATEIELTLEPDESVALRAERGTIRLADRHRPALGTSFDPGGLPSGRTAFSILETADATAVLDRIEGAGLAAGEPGLLGIHGSSWTQASWRIAPFDLTDPDRTGTPLLYPDLALWSAVTVASAQAPVEIGGAGPAIELVPRRPGAMWRGSLEGSLVESGLQSERRAAVSRFGHWRGGSILASGPLRKDRLGLLLAGSLVRSKRLRRGEPTAVAGNLASLGAHIVYTPSARDEVSLLGVHQRIDTGAKDRLSSVLSTWQRHRPDGLGASVALGYLRGRFPGRGVPPTAERLRDGPVPGLFLGESTRERAQLVARLEVGRGRHAARFGLEAARSTSLTRPFGPRSLVAETVDGLPARVWDYGPAGQTRWSARDVAVWGADRMRFGPLLAEAGLRFENTSAGSIDWTALLPRLGVRFRATSALTLRAGWALYRHRLPLSLLAFGDPAGPQGLVYRWHDVDNDGLLDPGETGPLVARVGAAFGSIERGLKPPRTDEWVLGMDARLGLWTVELVGIRRRERDLVASVNVGVPPSAYTVRFVPDAGGDILGPQDDQLLPIYDRRPESFGQDRYLLTNPSGANALHEGFELAVRHRSPRLWVLLGATASRTNGNGANRGFRAGENDQGAIGERLENPNADTYSRGRVFFDRAYTIKIAATWRGPWDLRLGTAIRYQDGQPFARFVIAPDLAQGPEAVQAIPRGRSRFTYTLTIDTRLEKGFSLGRRGRIAAVAEVFNLLDQANEVEEDVVTGPSFRAVAVVQPPRAVRLGLRLDF